ncbi:MAG: bifunctional DNA-formamidopyrimidine glycosylase/DNA-(apurinic or apyrimidinic site) lyase [Anaerolineae bacterium]|nr:bifunctional DNA-formamidopyrimidine glycosylase/DNA-(apurinic or apyrimidinic site) lyase [Gemmatimonadaceae bacterium]
MPELPETETMARDLDRFVSGSRITSMKVTRPDVLREVTKATFQRRVAGATIEHCWRRAKLVVLDLSTGDRIAVQPRFTGALLIDAGQLAEEQRRYSTVAFLLADGRKLHYRDVRRLGTVSLMSPKRWQEYSGALGIEPLDPAFDAAYLSGLVRESRQAIKKLIMDQRQLVGVGNIYANEALWDARIDPSRSAKALKPAEIATLRDAIVRVLHRAVKARGTSIRDYVDSSGERGGFGPHLSAYGREGLPCERCGARLVGTHAIDGRATVLCVRCQS